MGLRLSDFIQCSWFWVMLPIAIPFLACLSVAIGMIYFLGTDGALDLINQIHKNIKEEQSEKF